MIHEELCREINDGGAAEDLELWRFQTEKGIKPGETKWIKEQMEKQSNVWYLYKARDTKHPWE